MAQIATGQGAPVMTTGTTSARSSTSTSTAVAGALQLGIASGGSTTPAPAPGESNHNNHLFLAARFGKGLMDENMQLKKELDSLREEHEALKKVLRSLANAKQTILHAWDGRFVLCYIACMPHAGQ